MTKNWEKDEGSEKIDKLASFFSKQITAMIDAFIEMLPEDTVIIAVYYCPKNSKSSWTNFYGNNVNAQYLMESIFHWTDMMQNDIDENSPDEAGRRID